MWLKLVVVSLGSAFHYGRRLGAQFSLHLLLPNLIISPIAVYQPRAA
jgi:hypothetical protein